jgi:hypothetical protein
MMFRMSRRQAERIWRWYLPFWLFAGSVSSCGGLGETPHFTADADGPCVIVQVETSAVVELRWTDGDSPGQKLPGW